MTSLTEDEEDDSVDGASGRTPEVAQQLVYALPDVVGVRLGHVHSDDALRLAEVLEEAAHTLRVHARSLLQETWKPYSRLCC